MSRSVDHVSRDVSPQRVVVGIVDNDAFNRHSERILSISKSTR